MKQYVAIAVAVVMPLAAGAEGCESKQTKSEDPAPVVQCDTKNKKRHYGSKKAGFQYFTCGGKLCYYKYKTPLKGQKEPMEKIVPVKYPKTITLPVTMLPGTFRSSHCKWYVRK